jgi:mannitol-specific phosphotransferase system IIBC component
MFVAFVAAATVVSFSSRYFNTQEEKKTEEKTEKVQEKVEEKKITKVEKQFVEPEDNYSFHDVCEVSEDCECEFGFKRKNFKKDEVNGNVSFHSKFIFVCSGLKSTEWPERVESDVFFSFIQKLGNWQNS